MVGLEFYKGKKVLVTGHTGFKGTWLTKILVNAEANVLGYSRCSEKDPDFFAMAEVEQDITHVKGDVRDYEYLQGAFDSFQPEIVLHLAAQPIVRESYENPLYTYATNVMGTANVMEAIRKTASVKSAVIITTDKVYRNDEQGRPFREDDVLDGFDPYSNSKSCAELMVGSYKRSFTGLPPVSTARAGNVIGGGDFAKDRIIPDCVRAVAKDDPIIVRNPHSIRPFQHVLEPLFAYLLIAEKQWKNPLLTGCYNVGPEGSDYITAGELVNLFCHCWGDGASWKTETEDDAPHEASFLKLNCSLIKSTFGWKPKWHIKRCMKHLTCFYRKWLAGDNIQQEMDTEITDYLIG